jgi:hypothetical protein
MRYQSGLAPNTDFYDAKARLASVEANLVKSENEYQNALQALATMTGQPVLSVNRFRDELPLIMPDPSTVEDWTKAGLEKSLQMKSRRFETEKAREQITLQKAAHLPTLSVVGQWNQNNMGGSLFGGGATVDTGSVAINLDVPIFDGFVSLSKTREAGTAETRRDFEGDDRFFRGQDGHKQGRGIEAVDRFADGTLQREGAGLQIGCLPQSRGPGRGQGPLPLPARFLPEPLRLHHEYPGTEKSGGHPVGGRSHRDKRLACPIVQKLSREM